MFAVSKLLSFVTQPLAWVVLLLSTGLLLQSLRPVSGTRLGKCLGKRLCLLALALLLVLGWQPLPQWGLRLLEARHAVPESLEMAAFEGLVVLGGALESGYRWRAPDLMGKLQAQLNNAAERMTAPLPLLAAHPHLKLVFTGGSGELWGEDLSEAARAAIFYEQMGAGQLPQADSRLIYEGESRNTLENAWLSARLPGVDPGRRWLLVTSAFHMPRALAVFQKAGWNVTPYPVDFRAGLSTPWTEYSLKDGAYDWHVLLHEVIGLWVYSWRDAMTLSMRQPSRSTTSNHQPELAMRSPVLGKWPATDNNMPASVL
jgi:uncharacterized SAM-binding protein YcdF (DUF218 family)